jgi:hypothetical protein
MTQSTTTLPPATDTSPTIPAWGHTPPSAPDPPAKRKIGRYIVGGVVALFVLAGLAGGSEDKKDASSSGAVATTPTTTATPAATTRTTTAPSAAATISVATWAGRYGQPDSEQIADDLNALQGDAEAMDLTSMASSCRTMQRHITTAKSHLPTPDAQLTSALSDTYGYYDQAMTACISGAANMDVDDLTEMSSYISLATSSIQRATARIESLS